jgi:hypothetical protein
MAKDETSARVILQLRAVLRDISPLIWRRLLVPSDTTIARLHSVLQVAFSWEDMHLHRFEIRGREYGVSREGGAFFETDARKVRIGDLKLRRMERFTYEYDFGDSWVTTSGLKRHCRSIQPSATRSVLQGSAPRRQRTAAGQAPSWRIAGSTRPWVAVIRVRNLKDSLMTWMRTSGRSPAATTQVNSIDGRSIGYSLRWRRVRKEGPPMKITIQVLIEGADALPLTVSIHTIDRLCERIEDVGLQTVEAKSILRGLEQNVVRHQLAKYLADKRRCPHCQRSRAIKGYHPLRFRSAYGDVSLRSPRWHRCECERSTEATYCPLNDLLTSHTAPGLEFLLAKWAAHLSFSTVAELLQDVLPVDNGLHQETVRQHVMATADRLEAELGQEQFMYDGGCQRDIESSPEPGPPITVGLDGGYIRGRDRPPGGTGCFEVIAGKSIPEEGAAKVFALVRRVDKKPKRRLRNLLESQGILPRQHITFLSDGGDTVRELPAFLHPRSEHILDWFHIGMRIEQLMQTARGLRSADAGSPKELILKELNRVKWFLWHGNVVRADDTLSNLIDEVDGVREEDREAGRPPQLVLKKLSRALDEFGTYIDNNAGAIVNYGERYRCGERISTGFVESTINQLVAKRFVKKQQMRWTPRGAHLLLQVRVQVLNNELGAAFQRWYPKFG